MKQCKCYARAGNEREQARAGQVYGRRSQLPRQQRQQEAASPAYITISGVCLRSFQALDSYVPGAAVGQSGAAAVTAQALNQETHEQAMFMVDGASLLHYRDRGKQLIAGPDRQALSLCDTTHTLIKKVAGMSSVVVQGESPCEDYPA